MSPNVWAVQMPNGSLLSWLDGSLHVPELFGTRKATLPTLRMLRKDGLRAKAVCPVVDPLNPCGSYLGTRGPCRRCRHLKSCHKPSAVQGGGGQ